jgi:hypothetical protein
MEEQQKVFQENVDTVLRNRNSNVRDVLNKYTEVELSGNTYKIEFNLNAFAMVEDEYGDIEQLFDRITKGSAKATIALLWAGMQSHQPNITRGEVGSLASLQDMATIAQAILGDAKQNIPDPNRAQRRAEKRSKGKKR